MSIDVKYQIWKFGVIFTDNVRGAMDGEGCPRKGRSLNEGIARAKPLGWECAQDSLTPERFLSLCPLSSERPSHCCGSPVADLLPGPLLLWSR